MEWITIIPEGVLVRIDSTDVITDLGIASRAFEVVFLTICQLFL